MVWGTYNNTPKGAPSEAEVRESRYMQGMFHCENSLTEYILTCSGAWVSFAKDPENGLREYGWAQYSAQGEAPVGS